MKNLARLVGLLLALFVSSEARAVYQCGPDKDDCQCGMNNPYPCCSNGGNCTWWAWGQACCKWKVGLPGWGNANQWAGNAKAHPSYKVLSYPVVDSIANKVSGSYGHVAWVTAVSGSNVTVSEQNCWGGWGHQSATRDKSYYDGGYIVRETQCACSPGQTQTQSCGTCGEQKRTCASSCQWGAWSTCSGQGTCVPGETQEQACGNCGTQKRTCSSSCGWGAWGECGGEGVCSPGATDQQSCGDCGTASRTCKDDCSWGEASTCESDPSFVPGECDTGKPGVCAKGVEECSAGVTKCVPSKQPSTESCDWLDNDCDGQVDEGVCGQQPKADAGTGTKPNPDGGVLTDDETPADVEGSSGCTLAPTRSEGGSWILLFALPLLAHRRRTARRR